MRKEEQPKDGPLDGLGALLNDLHTHVKEGVQSVELAWHNIVPPAQPRKLLSIVKEDESPGTDPRGDLSQLFPHFDPSARPGSDTPSPTGRNRPSPTGSHGMLLGRSSSAQSSSQGTPRQSSTGGSRQGSRSGSVRSASSTGSATSSQSAGFRKKTEKEKFEAMVSATKAQDVQEARLARSFQAMTDVQAKTASTAKPSVHVKFGGKGGGYVREGAHATVGTGKGLHGATCRCPGCKEILAEQMRARASAETEKARSEQEINSIGGVRWR
mmetsp:Transcript_20872/g.52363  ORF Transcript_20872/g.52363 Transcript_20872/m.52363 type:complete len:270 (+) Transcript_20872:3-812(+)